MCKCVWRSLTLRMMMHGNKNHSTLDWFKYSKNRIWIVNWARKILIFTKKKIHDSSQHFNKLSTISGNYSLKLADTNSIILCAYKDKVILTKFKYKFSNYSLFCFQKLVRYFGHEYLRCMKVIPNKNYFSFVLSNTNIQGFWFFFFFNLTLLSSSSMPIITNSSDQSVSFYRGVFP